MKLSVVIPALNEGRYIEGALRSLTGQPVHEVLVVDGGSDDLTVAIAGRQGATVLHSDRGRARQMNLGAERATGDALMFLHADTRVPPDAVALASAALEDPTVVAGSFCLAFDDGHPLLRLYGWLSRLNNRYCTFGDQALFFRRRIFDELGGYRDEPFMEDLEIQHRVRALGGFRKIPVPVTTSARRFREVGLIRQQLLNVALVTLYECGVSPGWLKRFYS